MKKIVIASIAALAIGSTLMATEAPKNLSACMGCHGQNFERHALGVSKIVRNMTHKEIATALKGYKAGTFGGAMKGVMKAQLSKYANEDLEEISKQIGK